VQIECETRPSIGSDSAKLDITFVKLEDGRIICNLTTFVTLQRLSEQRKEDYKVTILPIFAMPEWPAYWIFIKLGKALWPFLIHENTGLQNACVQDTCRTDIV